MTRLCVERVRTYDTGMRVAEARLHGRITLWAQCYNTWANSFSDPENDRWIIVEFVDDKMATLFALTFDTTLTIKPCT